MLHPPRFDAGENLQLNSYESHGIRYFLTE